jgi:putative spermidine/putrescine transport system permease protein
MRKKIGISLISVSIVLLIFLPIFVVFEWAFSAKWYGATWFPEAWGIKWFARLSASGDLWRPLFLSFTIAPIVVLLAAAISIPAAYIIGTKDIKGKRLLENLFLVPLIVPPIASGIGILSLYTRMGLIDTYIGIVLVHMIGGTPYMLRSVAAAFESIDPSLEEAARVFGATRLKTIWKVYLPLVVPGILAGSVFTLSWSLNEFVLTLLVGTPDITTLPVEIFHFVGGYYISPAPASAFSVFLLVPSIIVVYTMERFLKAEYTAGAGLK